MTISWPVCTLRDGPPDPVTVKPRMYSETIALALHHDRTRFEVMLDPVASPDGRAFRPHMLIRNDTDGADMDRMGDVRWSVEVLCSDGMDARVSLDGKESHARRSHWPRRRAWSPSRARRR